MEIDLNHMMQDTQVKYKAPLHNYHGMKVR